MNDWLSNIQQILEDILAGATVDDADIHRAIFDIQTFKNKNTFKRFINNPNKLKVIEWEND
jgi:hypothetical protein